MVQPSLLCPTLPLVSRCEFPPQSLACEGALDVELLSAEDCSFQRLGYFPTCHTQLEALKQKVQGA